MRCHVHWYLHPATNGNKERTTVLKQAEIQKAAVNICLKLYYSEELHQFTVACTVNSDMVSC